MSATPSRESRPQSNKSRLLLQEIPLSSPEGRRSHNSSLSNESDISGCAQIDDVSVESASANGWNKFSKLLPYMWPDRLHLKIRVITCFILLIGVRVVNVFVPLYFKAIVDALMQGNIWPYKFILIWGALRLIQGGGSWSMGILNNVRLYLWISVKQYNSHALQTYLLKHIQNLSIRWHQTSQTGKTTRIMDRGVKAVSSLVEYILFSIVPTIIDIITAVIFFVLQFNIFFGLIMMVSMVFYFLCTWVITEWRNRFRREMNVLDNKQRAMGVDSLINAETVKYYSMEDYEVKRYGQAISDYQVMEWKSSASLQLLNLIQTILINSGLFSTALYCAYLVSTGELTVGDFSLAVAYFLQLMSPLSFLGTVYRLIQESFINTENMIDLIAVDVEVKDAPNAQLFKHTASPPKVEFKDLCFYYVETNPILKSVSFTIPAGSNTAIVGASGFGKSTMSKLIFRLYDPVHGCILINDKDIREYTQKSYRAVISVVPQEVILFNETILYNIAYGRVTATEKEVQEAAKMADIHDTIINFPDGYQTIVGERGLKLSGGEKQRIAIARALIKNPNIIIFDEATSALDTETEMHIQRAVENASRLRTVMIIAHRLSTIMFCDQILVLDEGRIVEQGEHEELLQRGGKYASLWNIQVNALNEEQN